MACTNRCIFHHSSRPSDCEYPDGRLDCAGNGYDIIQCYLKHYGNKLAGDAAPRLMEEFCHLLMANNDPEMWPDIGLDQEQVKEYRKEV